MLCLGLEPRRAVTRRRSSTVERPSVADLANSATDLAMNDLDVVSYSQVRLGAGRREADD